MYEIFEHLLQKHGVSTYQVSKVTGISQSTFSNWKNRRNLISTELGKKIADYFDVSLDYLMGNSFIEEMGPIIKEERLEQKITLAELSSLSGISVEDLKAYENDNEPIREDLFDDIVFVLGTSHLELLDKYGLYDEYILPEFNGDVLSHEKFKKAIDKDVMSEKLLPFVAKNDIERKLLMVCRKAGDVSNEEKEAILKNFESTIDMYLKAKGIKKE